MALADSLQTLATAFQDVHGRAPTQSEVLVLAAHTMGESNFGNAGFREWPEGQEQPNKRPEQGGPPLRTGTNNWGAVQYTGPRSGVVGYFTALDHDRNLKPYRGKYNLYDSHMSGARDFVKNASLNAGRNADVLPILDRRDPVLYARTQAAHKPRYFDLAPEKAGAGFLKNAQIIASKMGWPPPVDSTAGGASGILSPVNAGGIFLPAALAAVVYALMRK
jgi:hypothetical protein